MTALDWAIVAGLGILGGAFIGVATVLLVGGTVGIRIGRRDHDEPTTEVRTWESLTQPDWDADRPALIRVSSTLLLEWLIQYGGAADDGVTVGVDTEIPEATVRYVYADSQVTDVSVSVLVSRDVVPEWSAGPRAWASDADVDGHAYTGPPQPTQAQVWAEAFAAQPTGPCPVHRDRTHGDCPRCQATTPRRAEPGADWQWTVPSSTGFSATPPEETEALLKAAFADPVERDNPITVMDLDDLRALVREQQAADRRQAEPDNPDDPEAERTAAYERARQRLAELYARDGDNWAWADRNGNSPEDVDGRRAEWAEVFQQIADTAPPISWQEIQEQVAAEYAAEDARMQDPRFQREVMGMWPKPSGDPNAEVEPDPRRTNLARLAAVHEQHLGIDPEHDGRIPDSPWDAMPPGFGQAQRVNGSES